MSKYYVGLQEWIKDRITDAGVFNNAQPANLDELIQLASRIDDRRSDKATRSSLEEENITNTLNQLRSSFIIQRKWTGKPTRPNAQNHPKDDSRTSPVKARNQKGP